MWIRSSSQLMILLNLVPYTHAISVSIVISDWNTPIKLDSDLQTTWLILILCLHEKMLNKHSLRCNALLYITMHGCEYSQLRLSYLWTKQACFWLLFHFQEKHLNANSPHITIHSFKISNRTIINSSSL